MYPCVHCSIIYSCQDTEVTKVPVNTWMDKEVVVHIYNAILFKYKKNKNLVICHNMDGPGGIMLSEVSQTEKDRLCDFTYTWNLKPEAKQMNKHKKTETNS